MIIYAWPLDYLVLSAILINAVIIGIETDEMSQNLLADPPNQFMILGWTFCALEKEIGQGHVCQAAELGHDMTL